MNPTAYINMRDIITSNHENIIPHEKINVNSHFLEMIEHRQKRLVSLKSLITVKSEHIQRQRKRAVF